MDDLNYRCRQCGKPIYTEDQAMRHMQRAEGHTVDALLPALEPNEQVSHDTNQPRSE